MSTTTRVLITDKSSSVSKGIISHIVNGDLFNDDRNIDLVLYSDIDSDIETNDNSKKGRIKYINTSNINDATKGAELIFLSAPKNMNIHQTYSFFRSFGEAIGKNCNKNVKAVIISEPVNINTLIAYKAAVSINKNISSSNFTGLTLHHMNKLKVYLAKRMKRKNPDDFDDAIIWGSNAVDISNVKLNDVYKGKKFGFVFSPSFIEQEIMRKFNSPETTNTEKKSNSVTNKTKQSMKLTDDEYISLSAVQHMKFIIYGTKEAKQTSMSVFVPDDEPYGITRGIFFSLPVVIAANKGKDSADIKIIKTKCVPGYLRNKLDEEELFILKTINRESNN